jgi:hypothetical protein
MPKMKAPKKKFNFMPKKPGLIFQCYWGVYPKTHVSGTSVCYTTGKVQAALISVALNRFLNSPEGEKWLEDHK